MQVKDSGKLKILDMSFFLDQQFVTRCSVAVHMSFNNSYQMRETLTLNYEHRQVVNSWFVSTGHVM